MCFCNSISVLNLTKIHKLYLNIKTPFSSPKSYILFVFSVFIFCALFYTEHQYKIQFVQLFLMCHYRPYKTLSRLFNTNYYNYFNFIYNSFPIGFECISPCYRTRNNVSIKNNLSYFYNSL